MKLLISSALFYPSRLGGPANTLYWMAKALVKKDVKITVITTDSHIEEGELNPDAWSDVEGIRVRYCKSGKSCFLKELWHTCKEMKSCDSVMFCQRLSWRECEEKRLYGRLEGNSSDQPLKGTK